MSSIHIPPIPSIKMVTSDGFPTVEEGIWRQQELQSRSPWTPYTPTTTNLTVITLNDCAYAQMGKVTHFRVALAGTTDGVNRTKFTLPFNAKSLNQTFIAVVDPSVAGGTVSALSPIAADFLTITIVTLPGAGAHVFFIEGVYEAQ